MARKQSLDQLIRYEAKKRPEIAALVERAPEMTDAEIDEVKVPLPWYRQALRAIRRDANVKNSTRIGVVADPMGQMCRYDGDTQFIEIDTQGELILRGTLEVKRGALVWFPDSGGIWIDTIFSKFISPEFGPHTLAALARVTRSGYQAAVRDLRNSSANLSTADIETYDPDDRGLFRIQRH